MVNRNDITDLRLSITTIFLIVIGIGAYQILNEFIFGIALRHDIPTFDIGIAILTEVAVLWIITFVVIVLIMLFILDREYRMISRRNNEKRKTKTKK